MAAIWWQSYLLARDSASCSLLGGPLGEKVAPDATETNGVAERWGGSCQLDLLDHVIAMNQQHLKRVLADYISYYHEDRTHLGLEKQTPALAQLAQQRVVR